MRRQPTRADAPAAGGAPSRPRHDRARASTSSRSSGSGDTSTRFGRAVLEPRPDRRRAALRPRPAGDDGRALGGQGGRVQGARPRRPRASAGATSRSSGCRRVSRPSGFTAVPRRARSSSGWTGSRCRSRTNPSTPSRSRSGSGRPVADSSSRPTSRSDWTTASGGSSPASSGCGRWPRRAVRGALASTAATADGSGATRCLNGARSASGAGAPTNARDAGRDAVPGGRDPPRRRSRRRAAPERPARGHKGSFGSPPRDRRLARTTRGPRSWCCRAAGRAGAGLVTLAVPESLQPLFAAKVVETTTMALPEDDVEEIDPEARDGPHPRPRARRSRRRAGAAAGPGDHRARAPASSQIGRGGCGSDHPRCRGTPVAGDDGRLVAGRQAPGRRSPRTPASSLDYARGADGPPRRTATWSPMTRQARRPLSMRPRRGAASWSSRARGRSSRHPDGAAAIAPFENPALATGGTGDVLAGAIGSLLAQGLPPFTAARLGVYLHGVAGDAGRERFGDAGLLASDLPEGFAIARKRLIASAERRAPGRQLGFTARPSSGQAAPPPDVGPAEPAVGEPPPDAARRCRAETRGRWARRRGRTRRGSRSRGRDWCRRGRPKPSDAAEPSEQGDPRPVDGGRTEPSSTDATKRRRRRAGAG